jgi:hypothetical protein
MEVSCAKPAAVPFDATNGAGAVGKEGGGVGANDLNTEEETTDAEDGTAKVYTHSRH